MSGTALLGSLEKHVDVDGELYGITSRSRSEIVLPSLQARLPSVEVHGGHLTKLRVLLVKIQTLRLANVGATGDGEVHHALLLDLPHCLVDFTQWSRDLVDRLYTAVVGDNLVLDRSCPQTKLEQVTNKMLVNNDEFAR